VRQKNFLEAQGKAKQLKDNRTFKEKVIDFVFELTIGNVKTYFFILVVLFYKQKITDKIE
jgi:hypothetical protein